MALRGIGMIKSDMEKFRAIIKALAFNAGINSVDQATLRFYAEALKEFDIEQVDKAAKIVLREWEYPRIPPVATLIKAIEKSAGAISDNSKAEIECDKIISHLKYYGAGTSPAMDDPITAHLMNRRWPYATWAKSILESEIVWWRKEFLEAYAAYNESDNIPQIGEPWPDIKKLIGGIG
jgi:hypothetical protein